ncbi:MAG: ArdC family protein [Planctomycetota bacterium]
MSETRFYRKAADAATAILKAFESGDLPNRLALVFVHRKDNVPCRAWSWSNQLLTALTGHSDARGCRQWEKVGRHVKKGEKAFYILSPCMKRYTAENKETGEKETRSFAYGFTSTAVFGLSQTEGDPLPDGECRRRPARGCTRSRSGSAARSSRCSFATL